MSNRPHRRHRRRREAAPLSPEQERDIDWILATSDDIASTLGIPIEPVRDALARFVAGRGEPHICGICNTTHDNADPGAVIHASSELGVIFLSSPCHDCGHGLEKNLEIPIDAPPWFDDWYEAIVTQSVCRDRNGVVGVFAAFLLPT